MHYHVLDHLRSVAPYSLDCCENVNLAVRDYLLDASVCCAVHARTAVTVTGKKDIALGSELIWVFLLVY